VPTSIELIIARMLAKDPNQRPQRAGEVAEFVDQALETGTSPSNGQDSNRDLDAHPTHDVRFDNSEWPTMLADGTDERVVDTGEDGLSDLEPFGQADCESELKVLGSSEYSKYYFDHTRFNREALSPKVFLIIGRRGAGKTALSQFFSFQQLIPNVTTIEVDEPAAFQQLMSRLADSAAHSREIAIPRLVKIWEFVIWSAIFWELRHRDGRIKAACLFAEQTDTVSTFIRHVLKALVSKFLKASMCERNLTRRWAGRISPFPRRSIPR